MLRRASAALARLTKFTLRGKFSRPLIAAAAGRIMHSLAIKATV